MDPHSPSVLTSGSGGRAQGSEPLIGSARAAPGNLQSHTLARRDAPSVNGKPTLEGGDLEVAPQRTGRQPITVQAGVPGLRSQPIRVRLVVQSHGLVHKGQSQTGAAALTSSMSAVQLMSQQGVEEENLETGDGVEAEEQTEPLDLSLPKKREVQRPPQSPVSETSLIMEVDEFEGDGDRDLVEEDDDDPLLLSSFFSTSAFTSISTIEEDTENLLLIDDQGIPYTLGPDGLKVPQAEAPTWSEDTSSSHSQDRDTHDAAAGPVSTPGPDQRTPEARVRTAQETDSALPSVPVQSIQILTNPSPPIAPLMLLSSSASPQLTSAPLALSLPLSFAPPPAPLFLLVSSVPPSPSGSGRQSKPVTAVDPSSGQASPMAAVSTSVPPAGTSGQVSSLGPLLPQPSQPVVRLRARAPPVVLNHVLTSLSVPSSPATVAQHRGVSHFPNGQCGSSSSEWKPGCEAIPAEEFSDENKEPSGSGGSSVTFPSPWTQATMESGDLPTEHPPLDDHLYYTPAPDKLETLADLDPLSPAESPGNMGSRRVLYCQLCPRVFFYLSDLERHAITHSQKKPHVCQQCGKAFKRSSHLQRHKHIHTGQRNFVCTICAKRFREAGELQRHQRVHTGEKPYQCQLCHTRFAERNTLRRHTKRKHPYHQVAVEMLKERNDGGAGEASGAQEEEEEEEEGEESAEWYSSTVSTLDNSEVESEVET